MTSAAFQTFARTCAAFGLLLLCGTANADDEAPPYATIDGNAPGWQQLTLDDFEPVNCDPETWTMQDGVIHCTGQPIGVVRSKQQFTNVEIVAEWRHLKSAGNSGLFLWAPEKALTDLPRDTLPPGGIEIQVLDLGYAEQFEKQTGKPADWFTCHGDVFPVGTSTMQPFEPTSPNGVRSFPREDRVLPSPEWNRYYVRAINGEVRLWVNGKEVSGGRDCSPSSGFLCLESEGSPVEFRNLKVRVLP